ncbi:MAG: methyltransferase domain-containing protein [Alphaproteobacteria bacterium]
MEISRTLEEQAARERFDRKYRLTQSEVMLEIERAVFDRDYGGTSWTTRNEAEQVARMLGLAPGTRLLEVGAGSGWPGLYWALTTGCDVALVDVPLEGLRVAAMRAVADQLAGERWLAVADGAALPFKSGWFDAVSHSDVLCCLQAKTSVLSACRQAVRPGGKMAFTVLWVPPDLAPADYERGVGFGPEFVKTAVDYPTMLGQTGWKITDRIDLRAEFLKTARDLVREEEARADRLTELLGEEEYAEQRAKRRMDLQLIEEGLLRRDLFVATTASAG